MKKRRQTETALYKETQWLTLTYGDLQSINGDHVYNIQEIPYIIDFGFASYAPFYIDLVDYFSFENAALYHKALTSSMYGSLFFSGFVGSLKLRDGQQMEFKEPPLCCLPNLTFS